jgi:hypothetical protein
LSRAVLSEYEKTGSAAAHAGGQNGHRRPRRPADVFQLLHRREIASAGIAGGHLEDFVPDHALVVDGFHLHMARGADIGAGAAADAAVGRECDLRRVQFATQAAVGKRQGRDAHDIPAGPGAESAEDAVMTLVRDRRNGDSELLGYIADSRSRRILIIEQLRREFSGLHGLLRRRFDLQTLLYGNIAGGGQLPFAAGRWRPLSPERFCRLSSCLPFETPLFSDIFHPANAGKPRFLPGFHGRAAVLFPEHQPVTAQAPPGFRPGFGGAEAAFDLGDVLQPLGDIEETDL